MPEGGVLVNRSAPLVVACILLLVSGLLVILVGLLLIVGGGCAGAIIEEFGGGVEEQFAMVEVYAFGYLALIWGAVELAAAYGLWNLKRWAAYTIIVLSLISIGISIGAWNMLSIVDIVFSIILIALIIAGWKSLTISDKEAS
jgi:hypothetical protein